MKLPSLKLSRLEDLMPLAENRSKNTDSPYVMMKSGDGEPKFIRNRYYDHQKGIIFFFNPLIFE